MDFTVYNVVHRRLLVTVLDREIKPNKKITQCPNSAPRQRFEPRPLHAEADVFNLIPRLTVSNCSTIQASTIKFGNFLRREQLFMIRPATLSNFTR